MTPQIFRASTLSEARRAAEAALGEGAVMHTTRAVPRTGIMGWLGAKDFEISATPPEDELLPELPPAPPPSSARRAFSPATYKEPAEAPSQSDLAALRSAIRAELRAEHAFAQQENSATAAMEAELAALRAALEAINEGEIGGVVGRMLRAAGIEGKAATTIAAAFRALPPEGSTVNERFREALAEVVRVGPSPLAEKGPAVIACVGPTGVGKTTTLAKIAARAILDEQRTVTLIASDAMRVGAVDQLRRYASLLDCPFEVASTPRELAKAIQNAKTDLVLVDTAGRPPGRGGSIAAALGSARTRMGRGELFAGRARHVLLCLPANLRARDVEAFCRAFAPTAPTGFVITKLDETRSPASLVHGTVASGLPVTTLCFGQRVPEDIAPATSGAILDHLAPAQRTAFGRRGSAA
ncbi:MAG: flagellar biosynthesis protein FlhF [Polyangiaceae bacterium]